MGVNFYHSKTRRGPEFDWEFLWRGEDTDVTYCRNGFGYGMFAFVRGRMASHFDAKLGVSVSTLPRFWTEEMREVHDRIDEICPKPVVMFLLESDCEGCLSPSLCRKIVKAFGSDYDPVFPIDPCKMKTHFQVDGDCEDGNAYLRSDTLSYFTRFVWEGIRKAADEGLYFRWH